MPHAKAHNSCAVDRRRDRIDRHRGISARPRRVGGAGRRRERHGRDRPASGDQGRRRRAQARRQRGRCGGRGRLCARGGLSGGRQPRRRRLHDDPARRRPQDLPRFPREGAARRDRQHVPRQGRQRHQGPHHQGPSRRRRARHGVGPGIRAREVRHDEARRPDRAGDPTRRRRLRARAGRRRHARASRPRISRTIRRPPRSSSTTANRSRSATSWCRRTSPRRCAQISEAGADGFYKGPVGGGDRRLEPGRQGPDHAGRPRPVQDARAGAGRVRLPRLPRRVGAAAEFGRRHHLRDPQRPRGLSAEGAGLPLGAGGARPDRGDAPRLRRSQQLPRRSGLREEPARPPARQGLRRKDPRRDRSEQGRASRRTSSPASRRTRAATPRTIRSSTRTATRSR